MKNNQATQFRPISASPRRFTLRTLFITSVAVAVPFLLFANLRNAARPDDSLASPLYMFAGVAGILLAAVVGNALAGRPGLVVTAIVAGLLWILLVTLLCPYSNMLTRQLPVHAVAVIATIGSLIAVIQRHRESSDETTHEHLVQLLEAKHRAHQSPRSHPSSTDNDSA